MKKTPGYQASIFAVATLLAVASTPAQAGEADLHASDKTVSVAAGGTNARPIVTMGGNIDPFHGNIDPFGGNIDPFAGNIDPFAGNINPFYGDIQALWGTIDPFGGNIDPFAGNIDPFAGNIDPFYGNIDPFAGNIDPFSGAVLPSYVEFNQFWNDFGTSWEATNRHLDDIILNGNTGIKSDALQVHIDDLVGQSKALWGAAVEARTGQTFEEAFVNPLFAKYGIGDNQRRGFIDLTKGQRAQLVMDWYDGLMEYSGHDRVDHWMNAINWTPEVTKFQGSGADSVIGILDSSIINDPTIQDNVFSAGGYTAAVGGHGTGVASLILSPHDGQGIFGIAPNASVATYNPFDQTGTASWDDIRTGIVSLKTAGASVINMSLGITGWTLHEGWNDVFTDPAVKAVASNTVFVVAAGNDGSTQNHNIEWTPSKEFGLIIVGSVDPLSNVSSFSNRPGDGCLVQQGVCAKDRSEGAGYLRDRYLVAPGELILMSDGHGGFTRRSGTSFAAPLVSGAITLIHDRWPWLAQHPHETVDIILNSAQDLGAPGVDDIYGHGLLDVEAAQSPLDFNSLIYFESGEKTTGYEYKSASSLLQGGIGETWEDDGTHMVAFEYVGNTHRDFLIPLSTRLIGQQTSVLGSSEYFQSFITSRFTDWIETGGMMLNGKGFSDVATFNGPAREGWNLSISASSPSNYLTSGREAPVPHSAVKLTDGEGNFAFHAGYGQGSIALLGQQSFGLMSDYDAHRGGLNPVLGLASGGGFMDAEFAVAKNTKLAVGLTSRKLVHAENTALTDAERFQLRGARNYKASAYNIRLSHQPMKNATVSVSFASMNERDGLLGVQSTFADDFGNGANSKTMTVAGSIDLAGGFNLAASATAGMTRTNDGANQNFRTSGAVRSSAFALSVGKQGVMNKRDALRLSISQPMHVENGDLEYTSVEVIDRATGELGEVDRSFSIADSKRQFTGEMLYATPVLKNGELSLFGRADFNSARNGSVNEIIAGGMLSVPF